jgi:hypothetical protein
MIEVDDLHHSASQGKHLKSPLSSPGEYSCLFGF